MLVTEISLISISANNEENFGYTKKKKKPTKHSQHSLARKLGNSEEKSEKMTSNKLN